MISAEIGHKSSLVSASAQPYHFSNVLLHVFENFLFEKIRLFVPFFYLQGYFSLFRSLDVLLTVPSLPPTKVNITSV
jgi:hypothetical protein